MNEFERIAWIQKSLDGAGDLVVRNGDDAAVLATLVAPTISVDAQIEGVHFRSSFANWNLLGRRAVMSAMSDLGAMGAAPVAAFVSLELPSEFSEFKSIMLGAKIACDECGAVIAGGNLSGGSKVAIHTTVVGEASNGAITRGGGRAGDALWCAGYPGAAALGLEVLLRRDAGEACPDQRLNFFVDTWRRPAANLRLSEKFVGKGVTAAIDVSDGLVADLGHLAVASGVEVHIELAAIPRVGGFFEACAALGVSERTLLLHGGEVYDLVFAADPAVDFSWATRIGELRAGGAQVFVDGVPESKRGFDHFGGGAH